MSLRPTLKACCLTLAALCLALTATKATAQEMEARWGVRAGFHLGNEFFIGSRITHLEGFEIGADIPLVRKATGFGGISFSPTITYGGSNRHGADTDGTIYRLLVNIKRKVGNSGAYYGIGIGYSFTDAKVNEFQNVSGFASQYLLGYSFPVSERQRVQPFLEASYFDGSDNKTRGFSFNVGARF